MLYKWFCFFCAVLVVGEQAIRRLTTLLRMLSNSPGSLYTRFQQTELLRQAEVLGPMSSGKINRMHGISYAGRFKTTAANLFQDSYER